MSKPPPRDELELLLRKAQVELKRQLEFQTKVAAAKNVDDPVQKGNLLGLRVIITQLSNRFYEATGRKL